MVARKKKRMAVDPGTQKIGWAIGPVRAPRGKSGRVVLWAGIKVPEGDWLDRTSAMLKRINSLLFIHRPNEVIIEMPRSWDTGRGVGAKASGAILKLMFFVGCLVERAQVAGARVGLLGAGIWQGQLPKSVIYDRMNRRYDLDFPSNEDHWDISDAIGMLHYSHELERKIRWLR